MSFRLLQFKAPDLTQQTIPELNGLGLVKVKAQDGIVQNVTSLYVNDGGVAHLIWQPSTTPEPTDQPTQPPVGPCENQPVCTANTLVYYPIIPNTGGTLWDCQKWSQTGNTVDLTLNTIIDTQLNFNFNGTSKKYARVYSFNSTPALPPPPGYLLMDYNTYTIKDRIAVFVSSNFVDTANIMNTLTASDTHTLFPTTGTPFDASNGNLSNINYALNCEGFDGQAYPSNICDTFIPPQTLPLCACNRSCVTGSGGVELGSQGGAGPQCRSLDEIGQITTLLIDTSCIGTFFGCDTVCYGKPKQATATDQSPSTDYSCRIVGQVPNIITGSVIDQVVALDLYNRGFKFTDFAFVNDAGCGWPGDCPSEPSAPCSSAWKAKLFLPFYVNLPDVFYGTTGNPAGGNYNLKGKYIEILSIPDVNGISLFDYQDEIFNNTPILKTIQMLLRGDIRSCTTHLSFPWDIVGTKNTELYWTLNEYPRQIAAGVSSHTHQVVVEIINASADDCSGCNNVNGAASGSGPFSSTKYNIGTIRFYPITDTAGNLFDSYKNFLQNSLFGTASANGIKDIKTYRKYFHPDRLNIDSTTGGLFFTNLNSFRTNAILADNSGIHLDTLTAPNGITSSVNTPTNLNLNCNRVLSTIQQKKVSNGVLSTDCQCIPV